MADGAHPYAARAGGWDGAPRVPSRQLLLACAAIEAGIQPIE